MDEKDDSSLRLTALPETKALLLKPTKPSETKFRRALTDVGMSKTVL
jgi:hypothetical protein